MGATSPERCNDGDQITQSNSIAAAIQMLLTQQRDGYREAIHHLRLPRIYPEGLRLETYPAVLFQRAIALDGLLDAYAAGYSVSRRILESETFAILRAKHRDVRGGWNYIPEVLELPPDADDLGIVLQVLCRVGGPALASTCDEAIQLALAAAEPDGGIPTWILDSHGHSIVDEAMRAYVEVIDGRGAHPDVVSNLLYGLILYDKSRYHNEFLRAVAYLEAAQDERGGWLSRWYAGLYYGTYRVTLAISALSPSSEALGRAQAFLLGSQRDDGSWGEDRSDPLATALSVLALTALGMSLNDDAINRGVTYLVGTQELDGGWPASPFIAFPTSDGVEMHTYASRTMTTTFCLKALLGIASIMGTTHDGAGTLAWAAWPKQPISEPTSGSLWG
jgi:squalene-hopene/tetraprenyl-beta-curcumene cyclase